MKAEIVQPRLQRGLTCNQNHNLSSKFKILIKLFCVLEDDIHCEEVE